MLEEEIRKNLNIQALMNYIQEPQEINSRMRVSTLEAVKFEMLARYSLNLSLIAAFSRKAAPGVV